MMLDVAIMPSGNLRHDLEAVKRAEQLGFGAVWVSEATYNPFFPLTLAAKETGRILLGTQGALAFPRSPMVTAQIAWDLARQSEGRFVLGLGMQAHTHVEGELSEQWKDPVGRMREYIESLRAIWNTFQTDARLRYRGKYYRFRLMAPFFNPGPITHPAIPVYLAGLNPDISRLAGETCQGLHAPTLHTAAYLHDVVLPAVEAGLQASDRDRSEFALVAPILVISGANEDQRQRAAKTVRERLAFCAAIPECRRIMRQRGWESLAHELIALARKNRWNEMTNAITDEYLAKIAIIAAPADVYSRIREKYDGLADRVCLILHADSIELCEAVAAGRASQ